MGKILGYVLMLLGLAVLVLKFVFKTIFEKIPFLPSLSILWIIIISAVLIVIGFFISKSKPEQKSEEVPIYRDNKVIGYRRR